MKAGEFWIVDSLPKYQASIHHISEVWEKYHWITLQYKTGMTRTVKQQAAIEVYCRLVAEALNEQGITFAAFFKQGFNVPWSQEIVKDNIWRVMQRAVVEKESTKDIDRQEVVEIYDHLNLKLSEKFGIHIPWPVKEDK